MPLEDILRKIEEKAAQIKEEILTAAEAEAESKLKDAAQRGSALGTGILEQAYQEAAQIESIAVSRAEMQKKQMLLEAKQAVISQVFDEALKELRDMHSEEYKELLIDWISHRADGTEEVIISELEKEILGEDFIAVANQRLKEMGKRGNLTVAYSPEYLGGGLILRRDKVLDNLTFPAILRFMKEDLEVEIATMLFKETQEGESVS
ncbi:MAG TPA: V-type ATP synthase subunit E [Bacillota bacterium]|nr:V-type ATP synthase subunit E [Bacillota bacterium]HOK64082.1 V-type ATP synthase subunit E [Bacillota bacterium]HOL11591.1 V-type ATP synthase subunit E [Bacillota bacterium]HOQ02719.1 V-type ATP synthase subunit E [Bacillota bacterium]HPP60513.1 V-type ATP synthase subunit E [Bacillota bacterium]